MLMGFFLEVRMETVSPHIINPNKYVQGSRARKFHLGCQCCELCSLTAVYRQGCTGWKQHLPGITQLFWNDSSFPMEMVGLGQPLPLHSCGEEVSGILLLTPTGGKSALIWMG